MEEFSTADMIEVLAWNQLNLEKKIKRTNKVIALAIGCNLFFYLKKKYWDTNKEKTDN